MLFFLPSILRGLLTLSTYVISAGVASNIVSSASSLIDGLVRTHSQTIQRNGAVQIVGSIIRFPFGVALAPVGHLLKPITRHFGSNTEITADLILKIKRLANGNYTIVTGSEFLYFMYGVCIKVVILIIISALAYFILQNLLKFLNHYLILRGINMNKDGDNNRPSNIRRVV